MLELDSIDPRDPRVIMRHELMAAGYDGRLIARLCRSGLLHRVRHGAYTDGAVWTMLDGCERRRLTARAALRSARSPVMLTGPSAADELGAPVWDMGDETHFARLDGRAGRREAGIVQHRTRVLVGDLTIRNGLPVASGTRTAVDMLTLTDPEHALVTINGLLHTGETTLDLIGQRVEGMAMNPHTLNAPIVLGLAEPRCESAGETRAMFLLWRHHLPRPQVQLVIVDARGRVVARVDFAWPELGVFLEFDGLEKYHRFRREGESIAEMVLREKRREELICGLTGWRCIRMTWADLQRPARTAARIASTLAGQAWAA
ncbi:hypothetical protein [Nocardioides sp.]|uniref:hypothetical protein n=1 Tax=Nocardioides sp. TaxID=35761 RepID=UPI003784CDA7